jgi:thioredoxin reductase (NADPH)
MADVISTDVLIVGAGPAGLFQVFELGLLDIRAHVVDALPHIGGQCIELYPDKPIYDIPALPVCGAKELVDRLLEQIRPFAPTFHLNQQVESVVRMDDGSFDVRTSTGTRFHARTVVIAAGVGAFVPRKLKFDGAADWEGRGLHYRVRDPQQFAEREVVVAGGGDSALDWALDLVGRGAAVILVHRSQDFRAAPVSVSRMRALCDEGLMQFVEGEVVGLDGEQGVLQHVYVRGRDAVKRRIDADAALVFFGLSPKLGPIADWGLSLDRNQITVDTEAFRTSVPGIYAVGDINTYPGKKKLILSAFHEGALAAFHIREYLNPGQKVYLQYTTTSPVMHKRLGVETDPEFRIQRDCAAADAPVQRREPADAAA